MRRSKHTSVTCRAETKWLTSRVAWLEGALGMLDPAGEEDSAWAAEEVVGWEVFRSGPAGLNL